MGVSSNLEVFLSEKHVKDQNMYPPDSSLLVRPAILETHYEEDHEEKESNDNIPKMPETPLKVEIPSYKEVEREELLDDSNDDGFKTPTSEEHKIPAILQCPPAPRKPKTNSTKRKGCCRRRIIFDLTSQEIESLLPTQPTVDLAAGGNNKKLKLFTR